MLTRPFALAVLAYLPRLPPELSHLCRAGGIHIGAESAGCGLLRPHRRPNLGPMGGAVVCPASGSPRDDCGVRHAPTGEGVRGLHSHVAAAEYARELG